MELLKNSAIFAAIAGATNQFGEIFGLTDTVQKWFQDWFGIRWGSNFPTALLVGVEVFAIMSLLVFTGLYNLVPYVPSTLALGPVPAGVTFVALIALIHYFLGEWYWWSIQPIVGKNLTGFVITSFSTLLVALATNMLL